MSYDLNGDVMGDVMGDMDGDDVQIVGIKRGRDGKKRMIAIPNKPTWRKGQLAPGVQTPGEGYWPLVLAPQAGGGIFVAALPNITFSGQLQKPFRGRRLLVSTVRTGASATARLLGQLFVGTDLQGAELGGFDIELVGGAASFDTSLTMMQADPGVLIRLQVSLFGAALAGADQIAASITILGNVVT